MHSLDSYSQIYVFTDCCFVLSQILRCLKLCCCSSGLEEVQDAHLHGGSDGRQQHSDEEGPDYIPLSPPY